MSFSCDCANDCDDGSDESVGYASCSSSLLAACPSAAPSKLIIWFCCLFDNIVLHEYLVRTIFLIWIFSKDNILLWIFSMDDIFSLNFQ